MEAEPPEQECIYCLADMKGNSLRENTYPHGYVRERDRMRREGTPVFNNPMEWRRR